MVEMVDANLNKNEIIDFVRELFKKFGEIDEPGDINTFDLLDEAQEVRLKVLETNKWLIIGRTNTHIFDIGVKKHYDKYILETVAERGTKHLLLDSDNTADQDEEFLNLCKDILDSCSPL